MLKRVLAISLVLCLIVAAFAGCGKSNVTADGKYIIKGTDGKGNWIPVKEVSEPEYKSGDMTLDEFEKAYRPYTDWRIYEIRTTKSEVKPAAGGSSIGASAVDNQNLLLLALRHAMTYGEEALVEERIWGKECEVGTVGQGNHHFCSRNYFYLS